MKVMTQIAFAAAVAIGVPLVRVHEISAQSRQQSACPARFEHDMGILRKTLQAAAHPPSLPGVDYARLSREQARPLTTSSDEAVCTRLDGVLRITTEEQRSRPRSYFALGDHYVVLLPRDPKTRPRSEFGAVVFLDRELKVLSALTM